MKRVIYLIFVLMVMLLQIPRSAAAQGLVWEVYEEYPPPPPVDYFPPSVVDVYAPVYPPPAIGGMSLVFTDYGFSAVGLWIGFYPRRVRVRRIVYAPVVYYPPPVVVYRPYPYFPVYHPYHRIAYYAYCEPFYGYRGYYPFYPHHHPHHHHHYPHHPYPPYYGDDDEGGYYGEGYGGTSPGYGNNNPGNGRGNDCSGGRDWHRRGSRGNQGAGGRGDHAGHPERRQPRPVAIADRNVTHPAPVIVDRIPPAGKGRREVRENPRRSSRRGMTSRRREASPRSMDDRRRNHQPRRRKIQSGHTSGGTTVGKARREARRDRSPVVSRGSRSTRRMADPAGSYRRGNPGAPHPETKRPRGNQVAREKDRPGRKKISSPRHPESRVSRVSRPTVTTPSSRSHSPGRSVMKSHRTGKKKPDGRTSRRTRR